MNEDIEAVNNKYYSLFDNMTFEEVMHKLKGMSKDSNYEYYVCFLCDEILQEYTRDFINYSNKLSEYAKTCRVYYNNAVELFVKEEYYYLAVNAFFNNNKTELKKYLRLWIKEQVIDRQYEINEYYFAIDYISIFKNAYPDFYNYLADIMEEYGVSKDIVDLCKIINQYYKCDKLQDILDIMIPFSVSHSDLVLPKELIGYCYYDMKMWNNALAYFEQIEEKTVLTYSCNLYYSMAWCCGKAKLYAEEEKYYKKSIEINPEQLYARNNLGYSYYIQRRYDDAVKIFKECFELNLVADNKYAANNYVRTLIAMGLNKDANDFVASSKYKISKSIKDRLKKTDGKNHKGSYENREAHYSESDDDNVLNIIKSPNDFITNTEQFTSEKILEDELTARIESGQSVFGLQLMVWRRKGEYGRQYILPTGKRIDLLCEDNNGNIYVIELKKDSGYDDPYKQIVEYIEWFSNNKKFKDKDISGIICLNAPSEKLLDKVHKDKRIRLFEYQISYTER